MRVKDVFLNTAYFFRVFKHLNPRYRLTYNNSHLGEICVLGNGPSLSLILPRIITEEKQVFVMNDFSLSEFYDKVRPRYYIMVDPYYWDNNTQKIDLTLRTMVLDSIINNTNWKMELFVPDYVVKKNLLEAVSCNPNICIRGFNYTNFYPSYSSFYKYILRNNLGVVPVGNVLGQAIYLSINLGYDTINVYGAEHSWTKDLRVNEKNEVCTIKRHFFSDKEILEPWHKSNGELFKMHEILFSLMNHFSGYFFLNWYAHSTNRRILNCTEGSFIDAFDRNTGEE